MASPEPLYSFDVVLKTEDQLPARDSRCYVENMLSSERVVPFADPEGNKAIEDDIVPDSDTGLVQVYLPGGAYFLVIRPLHGVFGHHRTVMPFWLPETTDPLEG